jgi:hypothetical protein
MSAQASASPIAITAVVDDVVRKFKREVLLDARGLQLCANLPCKNVVAHEVVLAVMLMETTALAVIDKVVLDTDAR